MGPYIKVKCSRYRPSVAQSLGRGIALLFHDRGTRSTPWPHFTPGKTWYPFYRKLGVPQRRSGWAENLVPTGIRSRTIQPLVSRYTDWATRPIAWWMYEANIQTISDLLSGAIERLQWINCHYYLLSHAVFGRWWMTIVSFSMNVDTVYEEMVK